MSLCTFAVSAVRQELVTRRTQTVEAAHCVPALVLAGPPELTLVHVCPGKNVKSEAEPSSAAIKKRLTDVQKPTNACAISAGVARRTALPGDARRSLRPGQDWSSQRGHQLRAEPRPDSGTIAEDWPPLQACAGASIPEKHRPRRTQAPEGAGNVAAPVGARVWGLLTFINVWGKE